MLVLSRKPGEKILIGEVIEITIVRIGPNTVRIGIKAPLDMNIVREELVGKFEIEPTEEAGSASYKTFVDSTLISACKALGLPAMVVEGVRPPETGEEILAEANPACAEFYGARKAGFNAAVKIENTVMDLICLGEIDQEVA